MTEHSHYGPLIAGANATGMKLYRIHDGGGRNPFDIGGACKCGLGVAIEVKISHATNVHFSKPIDWNAFQPQQIIWLKHFVSVGALAIVATYYTDVQKMRLVRLEHGLDFTTGWMPEPRQTLICPKEDGKYTDVDMICIKCIH